MLCLQLIDNWEKYYVKLMQKNIIIMINVEHLLFSLYINLHTLYFVTNITSISVSMLLNSLKSNSMNC